VQVIIEDDGDRVVVRRLQDDPIAAACGCRRTFGPVLKRSASQLPSLQLQPRNRCACRNSSTRPQFGSSGTETPMSAPRADWKGGRVMIRRVAAVLGVFLVASTVAVAAGDGKVLRFRQYSLMDPQGIGGDAVALKEES
jgi:hypothetical protein